MTSLQNYAGSNQPLYKITALQMPAS